MARARNIKPGFFENEVLGTLDPIIPLTFAGLWCLADKDGILEDRPLKIKGALFPHREGIDVNGYLTVLEQTGFIQRYSVDGVAYIYIIEFRKHQHPHHTEKPKGYPKPPKKTTQPQAQTGEQTLAPLNTSEATGNVRDTPSDSGFTDSLIPDTRQAHVVDNSSNVDNSAVCVFLEKEGIRGANTEDPAYLDLVGRGATVQLFAQAAVIAADAGTPTFAYVLGIVRNKLKPPEPRNSESPARTPDPGAQAAAVDARIKAEREALDARERNATKPPPEHRARWQQMRAEVLAVAAKKKVA